ncbi:MAG: dynamin family protein [Pseudomonadota bacterium]
MDTQSANAATGTGRRPRLALMGEFSAGKSTLSNLLIGASPLPVKVTATQLPPVWISHGDGQPHRIDLEGVAQPVDLQHLEAVDINDTKVVRLFEKSDILELCDIIDMPGISDPNMSADVWQRVLPEADGVIWCTHATQAWRQSEAAVWDAVPEELWERSFLLLTRMDKVTSERDRRRVIQRVAREAGDKFAAVYPISLTQAIAAGDDRDAWDASGAGDFAEALVELLRELQGAVGFEDPAPAALRTEGPRVASIAVNAKIKEPDPTDAASGRVMPRRVQASGTSRADLQRPAAEDVSSDALEIQAQLRQSH